MQTKIIHYAVIQTENPQEWFGTDVQVFVDDEMGLKRFIIEYIANQSDMTVEELNETLLGDESEEDSIHLEENTVHDLLKLATEWADDGPSIFSVVTIDTDDKTVTAEIVDNDTMGFTLVEIVHPLDDMIMTWVSTETRYECNIYKTEDGIRERLIEVLTDHVDDFQYSPSMTTVDLIKFTRKHLAGYYRVDNYFIIHADGTYTRIF